MVLVSISDVLDVVGEFKRPLIEGEAILESKMLVVVGKLPILDEDLTVRVKVLCLQTSSLYSNPQEISVELDLKDVHNRVKSLSCSCKAGSSEKCKHSVATLMYLNRINDSNDLDDLSSTDLEQQWGKLKASVKDSFEAVPMCQYPSLNKPDVKTSIYSRGSPKVSEDLAKSFASKVALGEPSCEFFIHSSGFRAKASEVNCRSNEEAINAENREAPSSLATKLLENVLPDQFKQLMAKCESKLKSLSPEHLKYYKDHIEVSKEKALSISSGTAYQTEKMWFSERKCRITGSKCYSLFTYASNKSPDWGGKLRTTFESTFSGNLSTEYGILSEVKAKEVYVSTEQAKLVETGLFVNPAFPWLGYSPDGVVVDEDDKPLFLLEIKSPVHGKKISALELKKTVKCFDHKTNTLKKNMSIMAKFS